jgi:hypothetical protein
MSFSPFPNHNYCEITDRLLLFKFYPFIAIGDHMCHFAVFARHEGVRFRQFVVAADPSEGMAFDMFII